MFLVLQSPELEPVVKNVPEIIKQASQSQRGILALLIIVLFGLAIYFFRAAPMKWRAIIFFMFFGGVVVYAAEIDRIASKPEAVHYTGRVLDEVTSVPIHEARVTVSLANIYNPPYRSDSDGNFSFWLARRRPTDDAAVRIEHDAYREYDRTVPSDADTKLGDIRLVPLPAGEAEQQPLASPPPQAAERSLTEIQAHQPPASTGKESSDRAAKAGYGKIDTKKTPSAPSRVKLHPGPSQSSLTGSAAPPPRIVEASSGSKLSGKAQQWSPWYEVRVGAAPEGYTVEKAEFWLSGDRSCGAWAVCKETTKNDNEVIWQFRLQGHDEWGAPPQTYSEGHLRVTYKR